MMREQRLSVAGPEHRPDVVRYSGRPGFPAGSGVALGFGVAQLLLHAVLLWAFWWPVPRSAERLTFSITLTVLLFAIDAAVAWLLIRRDPALARGVATAPFVRITVSDRGIRWTLPWSREPLMAIAADHVRGVALGEVDARGRGNAVLLMVPDDPAADYFGNVHIDGLPDAARFVDAVARMA